MLPDRPDMTLDVYRGRKTTIQPTNQSLPDIMHGAEPYRILAVKHRVLVVIFGLCS